MKLITTLAAVCLSASAFGQSGVRYDQRVSTVATNVPAGAAANVMAIPNATVTICTDGNCLLAPAPVFSDAALTVPTANPMRTNGQGFFGFWAASGSYFYKVVLPSGAVQGIYPFTLGGSGTAGGSPGGAQTQVQFFLNSTTFGGAKTTTDLSTGLQLNIPVMNGSYDASMFQTSPGSNNGIANAEAAAAGGTTIANPNYPFTEFATLPTSTGTFIDRRGGGEINWATDPKMGVNSPDVVGYGDNCMFTYMPNLAGVGSEFCRSNMTVIQGIGNDAGGGQVRTGGDVSLITQIAAGITAEDERTINCWHSGDCHANRDTFLVGGTNEDLSREGHGDFMPHYIQFPAVWVSTIASITDQLHIKMNPAGTAGAYGTQFGGGWLVKQANLDSTNVTADNAPSGGIPNRRFTTSSTHAVSTAWGTTITVMNAPADFVNGDSTVIQVTKLGGTWPASGNVCISGNHTYETTFTSASGSPTVTLTLMSRYEEPVGSLIVVGSCMKGFSVPDRQINAFNSQISSEISPDIIGAPDANTYFYTLTGVATRDQNALNGQYQWSTDTTLVILAGSSVTRDASNNVLFRADSANNGTGYKFMGARTITVSGCANTNFNFGPSAITIPPTGDPFALQYVQPGAIVGAASTTGCSIIMSGLNGLTVHKAAKVISVTNPATPKNQLALNGYAQLGTHTMGLVVGDALEQPGTNSILIDGITEVKGQTPTLGGTPSYLIDWDLGAQGGTSGAQISGGFSPIRIGNHNPYSMYTGGGGLYTLPQFALLNGPWKSYWNIEKAPANGGQYVLMGCPPEGCSSPIPYDLFNLSGTVNGRLSYTPLTGSLNWSGSSMSVGGSAICTAASPCSTGNTSSASLNVNTVPKATGPNSIGNSNITDDGTTMTYNGAGPGCISVSATQICVTGPPYNASNAGATTTTTSATFGVGTSGTVASCSTFLAGQGVYIAGAGAAGANYIGAVVSCIGTALTVTPATSTSVATSTLVQHDESTAFQSAITALATTGGAIIVPDGTYLLNGPLQDAGASFTGTTASGSQAVTVSSTAGLAVGNPIFGAGIRAGTLIGAIGAGSITITAPATASAAVPMRAGGANSVLTMPRIPLGGGTGEIPIKIAGFTPTGNAGSTGGAQLITTVNSGALIGGYHVAGQFGGLITTDLILEHLTISATQSNSCIVLVDGQSMSNVRAEDLIIYNSSATTCTSSSGLITGRVASNVRNEINQVVVGNAYVGVQIGEHTHIGSLTEASNFYELMVDDALAAVGATSGAEGNSVDYMWCQLCTHGLSGGTTQAAIQVQMADFEVAITDIIFDPNNKLNATITGQVPYADGRSTSTPTAPVINGGSHIQFCNIINLVGCGAGGSISGLTAGFIPLAGSATTLTGNSHLDDGITSPGNITSTEPIFTPFVAIQNPSTTSIAPFQVLASSLTSGNFIAQFFGHDLSTSNADVIGFNYVGTGSASNYGFLGMYAGTDALHWFPDGHTVFGGKVQAPLGVGPSATALWTTGTVDPTGACSTGALYSNTSGAAGHVFWVCVAAAWVDDK